MKKPLITNNNLKKKKRHYNKPRIMKIQLYNKNKILSGSTETEVAKKKEKNKSKRFK